MLQVIIATHGPLADALLTSAKMVFGQLTRTSTVCLAEDGGIESFKQVFHQALMTVNQEVQGVLILCDLQSGTPYNVASCYLLDNNYPTPIAILTGVNLPMLLISQDFIDTSDVNQAAADIMAQSLESIMVTDSVTASQFAKPPTKQQQDDF